MSNREDTVWIQGRAKALGFDLCGVVRADKFPELAKTQEWLDRGYAGEMHYLNDARRADPQSVMSSARSVIVCALTYNANFPRSIEVDASTADDPRGWISRYAWGDDYHEVLWGKLNALVAALRERFTQPFEARAYADTGPLHERVLAKYAGLGWLGKNTLLLNQGLGSLFFLGTIVASLDLSPSRDSAELPPPDLCGTCRRCIDACPTQAFVEPYVMDARRCIAYLTIELRGSIPLEFRELIGAHVFGCDICQDVCPWNRRAPVTQLKEFQPRAWLGAPSNTSTFLPPLESLASLSEQEFRESFRGSPVKRTKWRGLVRNACIALGNTKLEHGSATHGGICSLLRRLAAADDPMIAESALWALSRIE